jgi:hypothetical protein
VAIAHRGLSAKSRQYPLRCASGYFADAQSPTPLHFVTRADVRGLVNKDSVLNLYRNCYSNMRCTQCTAFIFNFDEEINDDCLYEY